MFVVVIVVFRVVIDMSCSTPQLLIDGSYVDCDCCQGCLIVRRDLDRKRRFYWFKRKRGVYV